MIKNQKIKKKPLSYCIAPWLWLIGVDRIAEYLNCNVADIQNWITHYSFPSEKAAGILIARKRQVKKFLRKYNPEKTDPEKIITVQKPRKIIRKRRW